MDSEGINLGRRARHPDIVAIGASAGGVEAIGALLSELPDDLPATVLVVLHRPVHLPSYLPEVLERKTRLPVHLAEDGLPLVRATCLVAPSDRHLTITPELTVRLLPDHFYSGHTVDILFESLARSFGRRTIGVVLTGMLKDGTLGLMAIKQAGGFALVQSPSDSAHPSMPENAIRHNGDIDFVGTTKELAQEIRRLVERTPPQLLPMDAGH